MAGRVRVQCRIKGIGRFAQNRKVPQKRRRKALGRYFRKASARYPQDLRKASARKTSGRYPRMASARYPQEGAQEIPQEGFRKVGRLQEGSLRKASRRYLRKASGRGICGLYRLWLPDLLRYLVHALACKYGHRKVDIFAVIWAT